MLLLGDETQVKARFVLFRDSANFDGRLVHSLCRTDHRHGSRFGRTHWNSKVMWVMWNLVSVCWELVLVQDRCTVGVEHTIGSEIILDTPDGTPR